ncbi:hypothetical protein [Ectopseudomonas composti]|uniref:hypothetical protein n=1 Tax=Ectopseudomonas composti TaxID=658457 RepID=UPI0012FEB145|nr:hypothetical protein [Pseudomonas composti]
MKVTDSSQRAVATLNAALGCTTIQATECSCSHTYNNLNQIEIINTPRTEVIAIATYN